MPPRGFHAKGCVERNTGAALSGRTRKSVRQSKWGGGKKAEKAKEANTDNSILDTRNLITNRKEEIQTAAAKLFGEKGFAASSVRDIANAVGLGAASLYNHMGSKDELLVTICFRSANQFLDGMKQIEEEQTDPVEKIKELIRLQIRIALHDESSLTVFNDEWKHLQEPFLSSFLELRRTYETAYLRIIREGIANGRLKNTEAYLIYQMILSSLRWVHMSGVKKTKLSEKELTEQISSILINGIVV